MGVYPFLITHRERVPLWLYIFIYSWRRRVLLLLVLELYGFPKTSMYKDTIRSNDTCANFLFEEVSLHLNVYVRLGVSVDENAIKTLR